MDKYHLEHSYGVSSPEESHEWLDNIKDIMISFVIPDKKEIANSRGEKWEKHSKKLEILRS